MKVLILGLGQYPKGSGVAAALYFAKQGDQIIATDLKTRKQLSENVKQLSQFKNVKYRLGGHDLKDVRWADTIVRGPRVRSEAPEMKLARKLGKRITSDLSIFLEGCPCPVIGITGTRGKSTTTAMVHSILIASKKWRRVWLGGNILVSPLTFLSQVKANDIVVLEMSSWQLEATGDAGFSPQIAVWTNLMRDHLNTYANMDAYAEAKAQIFRHQLPDDVTILPADRSFDEFAQETPGRVVRISSGVPRYALRVPGEHNQMNASFAAAVGKELGVPAKTIVSALKRFKGLPDRLETIALKKGITFINDTTATTPDGTLAALKSIKSKVKKSIKSGKSIKSKANVHLIFGGTDKELEFDEIAKEIAKRKDVTVYLLKGTAERKIRKAGIKGAWFGNMEDAMRDIQVHARHGDTVLLSPGCTSFGMFHNEFDRGERFKELVKKWK